MNTHMYAHSTENSCFVTEERLNEHTASENTAVVFLSLPLSPKEKKVLPGSH